MSELNTAEKIEKLVELKLKGLITEEEFDKKKQELLAIQETLVTNTTAEVSIKKTVNKKNKIIEIILVIFSAIALIFFKIYSIADSEDVTMVKGGTLGNCPGITVNTAVSSFLGSPKWESIVASNGNHYVNVSGTMFFMEKKVTAAIQFGINREDQTFKYQAFEINEVPQSVLVAGGLLNKMCATATENLKTEKPKLDPYNLCTDECYKSYSSNEKDKLSCYEKCK